MYQAGDFEFKVFYLWDFGVKERFDVGFSQSLVWDIPLLKGYCYEFVPNVSKEPGTEKFMGLDNPSLFDALQNYEPDAVLLMNYVYIGIMKFMLKWNEKKSPIIFRGDSHRLCADRRPFKLIRTEIIKLIFNRFSAFLYVGKANYEYFQIHGVAEKKLFFAPHAVENDRFLSSYKTAKSQAFLWKKELGIPEDKLVILFAGKFISKKRPLDLLNAFFMANLADAYLLFVGSGALENELKRSVGNDQRILFIPFQNQSSMPRVYASADLFVLPSYGLGETWGLAVNEAMCMSLPVIVSDHVGCAQDLVYNYKNGLIFKAGDVSQLADCVRETCRDKKRLKQWGDESKRVIGSYNYVKATEGLRNALNYVLSRKSHVAGDLS